jgi:hypothetical protein
LIQLLTQYALIFFTTFDESVRVNIRDGPLEIPGGGGGGGENSPKKIRAKKKAWKKIRAAIT